MSREALLVLGMHRSGTSAVAGLLVRLGVQGPKTLMPADADNPAGYSESAVFLEFHERLLRAAGSRWDSYTRLDPEWLQARLPAELGDECRRALRAEFGDGPRFVLKDPRMCRFVPFWLRILRIEGIAPAAVLVWRSPLEVAQSLAVRNRFERDLSLLMWLRHALDAEFDTRAIRRTFVRYQDVLGDWKLAAQQISRDLETPWPGRSSADDDALDRFVNPGLRHHDDTLDTPDLSSALSNWLRRTWTALEWLHDGDASQTTEAFAALDAVRLEFDRATSALGDVGDRIRGGLEAQIGNLTSLQLSLQEARAAQEQQAEELQRRVQTCEQDRVALQRELSVAHQDAQALRESTSWRITAPLRAVYRLFR